ncbi:helix-turn-helix domain-containing protein [Sciscionella sediminilitoris]|uniref:helix-turn-helix domain-containing protein n=1 Tax=Sciscionella sediminilitoris TaxID=1445613 RepID=UPI0004DEFCA6|nr:helix-turn-helix domain-containing protein [Sciscionella sp. SE31]
MDTMTPAQVVAEYGFHLTTVHKALEAGELHGHQRKFKGRWRIERCAVEAWIKGGDSRAACCGSNVRQLRRRTA